MMLVRPSTACPVNVTSSFCTYLLPVAGSKLNVSGIHEKRDLCCNEQTQSTTESGVPTQQHVP